MYRVNYGNGQVSESFKTKSQAEKHIAAMDLYQGFAFVQVRTLGGADEPGEWVRSRASSRVGV